MVKLWLQWKVLAEEPLEQLVLEVLEVELWLQWRVLAAGLLERLVLEVESALVLEGRLASEADHLELILTIRLAPHLYP